MRVSEIAFLFSSDNDKTKSFVKGQSVYISPHTFQLLETARANHHQWYVFLDDVFPLVSMTKFKQFMKFQTKSLFHLLEQRENEWKTSPWCILSKADVETILSRRLDYDEYLKKKPYKISGTFDELYFLSLLKYVNPAHSFLDYKIVYSSNVLYNRVLKQDLDKMKGCFFLRKTTPTFTLKPVEVKKTLVIKILGEKSPPYETNHDLIMVSTVDVPLQNALYLYRSTSVYKTVLEIIESIPIYLWSEVIVLEGTHVPTFVKGAKVSLPNTSLKQFYKTDHAFLYAPDKIAFLFLTIGDVNQPHVWTDYFKEHQHKVSVYTHAKFPAQIKTPFLKKNVLAPVETGWGFITNAYYQLFQAAMQDVDNVKFVTISESCIPLKKFSSFYRKMMEDDPRTSYVKFMNISGYDRKERIESQNGFEKQEPFTKHYARMCLSRYHVEKLLKKPFDFFNGMHVGDEFFLTLLKAKDKVDFMKDFEITYDNWEDTCHRVKRYGDEIYQLKHAPNTFLKDDTLRIKRALRDDCGRNPKTYTSITLKELEVALRKESFFWRKFPVGPLPWTNDILTMNPISVLKVGQIA